MGFVAHSTVSAVLMINLAGAIVIDAPFNFFRNLVETSRQYPADAYQTWGDAGSQAHARAFLEFSTTLYSTPQRANGLGSGPTLPPRPSTQTKPVSPPVAARGGRAATGFIDDVVVKSHGKVIGRGTVDVRATVEGIQSGKLSPRDIFRNDQGLLPKQGPVYYQEFVHPTPGVNGVGSQRIVRGKGGELFHTPDHYTTFIPIN